MSILIDCSAAHVALPRERALADLVAVRLHVDDAQPRLLSPAPMPVAAGGWRRTTGSTMRGFETGTAALAGTQDGRTGTKAGAYLATNQHFSIRSGPPTSRP